MFLEQTRKKQEAEKNGCRTMWIGLGIIVFGIILGPLLLLAAGGQGNACLYGFVVLLIIIGIATFVVGVNEQG